LVLRYDHDGTGDSSGTGLDPDRVARWREGIHHAVDLLRSLGAENVNAVGIGMGATLAVLEGADSGLTGLVMWNAVVSGKRFVRKLQMLGESAPSDSALEPGTVTWAGLPFTPATLADIARLDLRHLERQPAPATLVLGDTPESDDQLVVALRTAGSSVSHHQVPDDVNVLTSPAEDAVVPAPLVATIASWLLTVAPGSPVTTAPGATVQQKTDLRWHGRRISEEVLAIGDDRLVGIRTTGATASDITVVLLNSGSEPHVGPGRAWVEYARALAVEGITVVRTDFAAWGESPDLGHEPGRPYDAHAVADTLSIVRGLTQDRKTKVVLAGLCAGAWVGLRATAPEVAGVVAINPQLYWSVGDPVEALIADTRVRRSGQRRREERGGRYGIWSMLDRLGLPLRSVAPVDALLKRGTPVLMLFAQDDDGLEFLNNRARRWLTRRMREGRLRVVELDDLDHQMYRIWRRPAVVGCLRDFVWTLTEDPPSPS
jgi:pimeloyl-ACP methyl ester carboxylesterase